MTGDNYVLLPSRVLAFGEDLHEQNVEERVQRWQENITNMAFFLILAGSQTAEIEGISAAGSTAVSRRYTAVADAELLLRGPNFPKRWPLPPLPAGVSPALISYVASSFLKIKPTIISAGLLQTPPFTHVSLEPPEIGPARCLSSGNAMERTRVKLLFEGGYKIGKNLKKSLLLTECVPGGTSTAFAVLSGLGINVDGLISGSHRNPPSELKIRLVKQGLEAAKLKKHPSSFGLMAAVGDPFQPIAVGLLMGARESGQEIILGGGCQMLAVLALALNETEPVVLSAGQMSLHHPTVVHGSGINKSNDRRIGFVVQSYIGSDVDQVIGKMYVQQARGDDEFKYHEHVGRPIELMNHNDIQTRKKANDELSKIFYSGSTKKGKY